MQRLERQNGTSSKIQKAAATLVTARSGKPTVLMRKMPPGRNLGHGLERSHMHQIRREEGPARRGAVPVESSGDQVLHP